MSAPPVEWVAGDPLWARRFSILEPVAFAAGISVPILFLLGTVIDLSPGTTPLVGVWIFLTVAGPFGGVLAPVAASWIPRRWPVIRRLGISPLELRLEYSFRKPSYPWSMVRWKDPRRIEISLSLGSVQFLLTEVQANRIRSFFQYSRPLPSSAARWGREIDSRTAR